MINLYVKCFKVCFKMENVLKYDKPFFCNILMDIYKGYIDYLFPFRKSSEKTGLRRLMNLFFVWFDLLQPFSLEFAFLNISVHRRNYGIKLYSFYFPLNVIKLQCNYPRSYFLWIQTYSKCWVVICKMVHLLEIIFSSIKNLAFY